MGKKHLSDILPQIDSTHNIGATENRWANIYADTLYGDGSNITNISVDTANALQVTVKNVSGGQLTKGTVVHVSPSASPPSGNVVEVIAADYDDAAKMPAVGILKQTIADGAEGEAVMSGALSGIATDGFTAGDELYVGADGALTNAKPQTAGQLIQKIAVCVKSHATNGLIKIFGAGRSNDVPLPLYIDNTNQRVGIGTAIPGNTLDVNGEIRQQGSSYSLNITGGSSIIGDNHLDIVANGSYLNLRSPNNSIFYRASSDHAFKDAGGSNEYLRIKTSGVTAGNVGIGTTSPDAKLEVSTGTDDGTNTVLISHTRNNSDVATEALKIDMDLSGADTTSGDRINSGIFIDIDSSADGDASNEHRIYGINSDVRHTGFSDIVRAGYFRAENNNSTEKVAQLVGAYGQAEHDSNSANGGVASMMGVFGISNIQDTGDVDNAYGGYFNTIISTNRVANVDNTFGVRAEIQIDKDTPITFGNMIGVESVIDNNEDSTPVGSNTYLFKGDYQGTRFATNAWGIYVEGNKNYFEGNVGIGTTNPIQKLHVLGSGYINAGSLFIDSGQRLKWGNSNQWIEGTNDTSLEFSGGGGGTQMILTSDGSVGIGTTSPGVKLDIVSSAGGSQIEITSPVPGVKLIDSNLTTRYAEIKAENGNVNIDIDPGQAESISYFSIDIDNSEKFRIDKDGNVGIGTTLPVSGLQISTTTTGDANRNTPTAGITLTRYISGTDYRGSSIFHAYQGISGSDKELLAFAVGPGNSNSPFDFAKTKMVITEAGDVGIGTTSPAAKLEVAATNSTLAISYGNTVPNNPLHTNYYGGFTGIGMDSATAGVRIVGDTNTLVMDAGYYAGQDPQHANWNSLLKVLSNGNVGIGTDSPETRLDVAGAGNAIQIRRSNGYASIKAHSDNSGHLILDSNSSANAVYLQNYVAGNIYMVNGGGNVGIGTTSPSTKLHVDAASGYPLRVNSTQDYMIGLSRSGTDEWWFKAYTDGRFAIHENGVGDKVTIKAGGNVGIGTTDPSEKLNVGGNILATGTILGSNLSGTNTGDQDLSGYALTSHNHDDRYYTETESDNRFLRQDGSNKEFVFEVNDEGNLSGNKWYKIASVNQGNGGLHIRGFIANHVESFTSQKIDIAINGREGGNGANIEIIGTVDVLHNASSGTDKAGIRVIKGQDAAVYDRYDVYVRTSKYNMLRLHLTKSGNTSFHTSPTPVTTEPQPFSSGATEIDTSSFLPGVYTITDSEVRQVIKEDGKVGIGTDNPSEKLEVDGNILAAGTILGSNLSGTNTGDQDLSGYALTSHNHDSDYVNVTGDTLTGTLNYRMLQSQSTNNYDTAGDASGFSVFYGTGGATNKPSGTDHAVATFSYSDLWQTQLAMDWRTNSAYLRTQENGTWKGWNQLFTDGYHPNADTWTTGRTITIGNAGKSINGSANVSWTLSEIGAAASSHNHDDRYYTETEVDEITHQWEWRWQRWQGLLSPASESEADWTSYYKTYFTERTESIDTSYPPEDNGYINTKTNVGALGGFGGSTYGNIFGNLSSYHVLIYANIYVDKEFTVNVTTFNGDDAHAIFIDGKFVRGSIPCCSNKSYSYTFKQGWHRIDLIYSEGGGGDYITMGWNPKDYTDYISQMHPHLGSENPNYILNKLKEIDGPSSGLDADTLDGQEGTYYLNYANFTSTPNLGTAASSAATDFVAVTGDTINGDLTVNADFFVTGSAFEISAGVATDFGGETLSNIGAPSGGNDATTKTYVDNALASKLSTTGKAADSNLLDGIDSSSFLRSDAQDAYTPKRIDFSSSTNWDAVGFGNLTNLHMQGHNQFWIGAGNGTWFTGTANSKSSASGLAADGGKAHDLLITTMPGTSTYDRGITFAVDTNGAGTGGYRLGKWHSSDEQHSSKLTVDGGLHVRGGDMLNYDYYADDYSTYWDNQGGGSYWVGDTGWIDPSITAGNAIQIQAGNTTTNSNNPSLQFHQYGYGGVQFRYDGPGDRMYLESTGSNRMDWFRNKTDHGYIDFGPANTSHAHIYTDRPNFYLNKSLTVSGSSIINSGDIRSAIFYDLNNTGYYLDPASTGVALKINGIINQDFQSSNLNTAWTAPGSSFSQGFIVGRYQGGSANQPHHNDNANWFANIYSHSSGGTASYGLQLAGSNASSGENSLSLRTVSNGSFSAWRRIYHEGHKPTYSELGTMAYSNLTGTPAIPTDFVSAANGGTFGGNLTINGGSATYALGVDGAIATDQYIAFIPSGVNSSPDMTISVSNNVMTFSDVSGSGYADFNVDSIRAELYYDRDNTSYYLNPASTSVINTITLDRLNMRDRGDFITFYGDDNTNHSISSRDNNGAVSDDLRVNSYHNVYFNLDSNNNNSTSSTGIYVGQHGAATGTIANAWTFYSQADGITFASGSFRAPIFYDSNDTTYYIDPNSTSRSARLRGEILIGPNTSSKYLKLGGDGGGTTYSTISTSNGNLHIDSTSGFATYINHYAPGNVLVGNGGGYLHVYNSVRSPIFYDLNNTAYYLDPGNSSVSAKFAGSVEAVSTIGNLTSGSLGQQMEKGSTSVTTLRFDADRWRLYAGAGSGEVVTVQQGGNVGIGTTSPSQKLDVVGSIEVSDGVYIGGTAAANKLDDYEEGTFAPTITATGTDTGVSGNGQYTKIGNQVHVEIRITKFLDEDDSCAIQSVTLPFTAKATSNVNYKGNVFMFTGNIVNQYARLQEGTNSLTLYDPGLRLSLSPDETNEIGISITYLT